VDIVCSYVGQQDGYLEKVKNNILYKSVTLYYMAKTKIIYFVRHGESILNAQNIRQGPEGGLSGLGMEQARKTAEGLAQELKPFEVIISSPYERTVETARIIQERLNIPVEYTELLVERKNPTEIIGKYRNSTEVLAITDRIDNTFHGDDYRYSDEENFIDLKKRAHDLLTCIEHRPEDKLLMVTHGIFLKMFVSYMLYGERMKASDYIRLSYESAMDNAGVVICSYTTYWFKKPKWRLLLWNGVPAVE
jgi:broad specificity phosphatase PhoE